MLVAPARLLGLGLIITRRAVVSLIWGPQYPRWNSSGILLKKATTARRKNLLAFACLFTFYACLFIFCACLFTFFLGANHKAPTFHVTLW